MNKIFISLVFLLIASDTLLADRYTAIRNAVHTSNILESRGYSIRDIAGRHLRQNHYRTYNRFLYSGNCYAIVSVGDNSVRDLDLRVYDRSWRYLGGDRDYDKTAVVKFCPAYSGTYRFRTRMYRGSGHFRMIIGYR